MCLESAPAKKARLQFDNFMVDKELIRKIVEMKSEKGYTLFDLSKRLDLSVSTIERWLKTNHINKVYAKLVKERLGIDH